MALWVQKKLATPPPELEIGWTMTRFGGLPYAGGILDQPYGLMLRIRTALNFEALYSRFKSFGAKQLYEWSVKNPELLSAIMEVEKDIKNGTK